ncbi:hypothetical protein [Aurantivibrio infirmus]
MRFRKNLALASILWINVVSLSHAAEEKISAEFWQWYLKYADENGEVFDPLALQELDIMTATLSSQEDSQNKQNENARQDSEQTQKSNESQKSTSEQDKSKQEKDEKETKVATQELLQP